VRVNCAALVETLLLSELFGHERGAFTGAHARHVGRFEAADGGTLFLDEIGDISARTQAALLRVLQERSFERVGGTTTLRVDVRVIAATHRDLPGLVARGEFREDLYYRLRGMVLDVPPLRARLEDVPSLAEHLLARIAMQEGAPVRRLDPSAAVMLQSRSWPGNVRELENVLRAATVLAPGDRIGAEDLRGVLSEGELETRDAPTGTDLDTLYWDRVTSGSSTIYEMRETLERRAIERAIDEADGNLAEAARKLGMKRPRLSQLAKEYGLRRRS
jgi:transcriptional regulator with GAF, ATPase, and Fis domain